MDINDLLQQGVGQGLGYGMFLYLLFYVLKQQEKRDTKSEEREVKYQSIIEDLTRNYTVISGDVRDIKEELKEHINQDIKKA